VFTSRWHKIISGGTFLRVRSTLLTGPTEAALIEEIPVGVAPQRPVQHHRPEVRAADANVDDGLDPLIEASGAGQEDQQLDRFPGQGARTITTRSRSWRWLSKDYLVRYLFG
jgi:hypothetical protein